MTLVVDDTYTYSISNPCLLGQLFNKLAEPALNLHPDGVIVENAFENPNHVVAVAQDYLCIYDRRLGVKSSEIDPESMPKCTMNYEILRISD